MAWVKWARSRIAVQTDYIHKLEEQQVAWKFQLEEYRQNASDFRKIADEAKEQVMAYEKVISSRKALTVMDIGEVGFVVPPGKEPMRCTIRGVHILERGTFYDVTWWDLHGRFCEAPIPASEVVSELPLNNPSANVYNQVGTPPRREGG